MSNAPITRDRLFQYGAIAIPLAFAGFPLYVLAPDFYATNHGMSLALLGMILLLIRLWDAVQDPLIGWMVDKSVRFFMPIAAVALLFLCLSITLLFNTIMLSPVIWFGVCMFMAVTAYSVIAIILGAQATLWTEDKNDQTRIAGVREAFGLVGLILAVSMPSILQDIVPEGGVYLWYGFILTILGVIALFLFSKVASINISRAPSLRVPSPFTAVRSAPRQMGRFFAIYAVSMLASSIPAVLVIFFVRDFLGAEQMVGPFLLLYFLSGIVGMPLWKRISITHGKYAAWAMSNILAIAGFAGAFFLGHGDIVAYAIVCLVSGLALGADLTLPPSILSSQIHADNKQNLSGTYYALLAFIGKISLAVASAIALPSLDYAGFVPQAENDAGSLWALSFAYALIPCVLKFIAAVLLYCFFIAPSSGEKNETV